jgi:hypothetical protein
MINLIVTVAITIVYLIAAMKALQPFFNRISNPMTQATGILYIAVILGFGISLNNFAEIATSAFHYYEVKGNLFKGVGTWMLFGIISFGFSYLVFLLSYSMVRFSTQENEKAELGRNNFTIAGIHAVVFIVICLLVSKPLTDLANTFISYPQYPN